MHAYYYDCVVRPAVLASHFEKQTGNECKSLCKIYTLTQMPVVTGNNLKMHVDSCYAFAVAHFEDSICFLRL